MSDTTTVAESKVLVDADQVIEIVNAQLGAYSSLAAEEALKKVRKGVEGLKKKAQPSQ